MWRLLLLLPLPALADSVVATRNLPPRALIAAADLALVPAAIPGALTDLTLAVGQQTRVAIYAGRPLRPQDIVAPLLIGRNQIIPLAYRAGGLSILTEGRALMPGAEGDLVDVLNLSSHQKVTGRVGSDGTVHVTPF